LPPYPCHSFLRIVISFLFGRHLPERRRRNYGENSLPSLLIIWTWVPVTKHLELDKSLTFLYHPLAARLVVQTHSEFWLHA
jgi:hypothetical protein